MVRRRRGNHGCGVRPSSLARSTPADAPRRIRATSGAEARPVRGPRFRSAGAARVLGPPAAQCWGRPTAPIQSATELARRPAHPRTHQRRTHYFPTSEEHTNVIFPPAKNTLFPILKGKPFFLLVLAIAFHTFHCSPGVLVRPTFYFHIARGTESLARAQGAPFRDPPGGSLCGYNPHTDLGDPRHYGVML